MVGYPEVADHSHCIANDFLLIIWVNLLFKTMRFLSAWVCKGLVFGGAIEPTLSVQGVTSTPSAT